MISVDDMHNNDIASVNNILDAFIDHKTTKVMIISLYNKKEILKKLNRSDVYIHTQEFVDKNGINALGKFKDHGFCIMQGIDVFPNGDIRCDCPMGIRSCKLGTTDDKIEDLVAKMDSIWDYFPFFPKDPDISYCAKNPDRNIFKKNMMQSAYFSMDFWLKKAMDPHYEIR